MLKQIFYIAGAVAVGAGLVLTMQHYLANKPFADDEQTSCTMDARQCPDGTYVGRTGPNCEFTACPTSGDVQTQIDSKANLITVAVPVSEQVITSPLSITGEARGHWFFEASFPISLTNWDGLIIAEGYATANGDWMTNDFVPYTATLEFISPYIMNSPDFMKNGILILKKDNPSGLPEHDDALEIPIRFAQ